MASPLVLAAGVGAGLLALSVVKRYQAKPGASAPPQGNVPLDPNSVPPANEKPVETPEGPISSGGAPGTPPDGEVAPVDPREPSTPPFRFPGSPDETVDTPPAGTPNLSFQATQRNRRVRDHRDRPSRSFGGHESTRGIGRHIKTIINSGYGRGLVF